jgi:hypothetical protein
MAATIKKKHQLVLDVSDIEDDFFEDVSIFGLRAPEEIYHVIWTINKLINFQLKPCKSYAIQNDFNFDMYEYFDKKNSLFHYIYTNRKHGNIMMRDLRGFHFLWCIKGFDNRFYYIQELKEKLSKEPIIELFQNLDIDNITNKSLLLF